MKRKQRIIIYMLEDSSVLIELHMPYTLRTEEMGRFFFVDIFSLFFLRNERNFEKTSNKICGNKQILSRQPGEKDGR